MRDAKDFEVSTEDTLRARIDGLQKARLREALRWLSVQHDCAATDQHMHTLARHEHQCTMDRIGAIGIELARLREALVTIERTGAPGATIVAQRSDGHSCSWCRGMVTPCPVVTARAALAETGDEGGKR